MIRFEHIEYLWLLAGVAFLGILWGLTRWLRRRRLERWADREMWGRLIPDERKWRPITKAVLILLGLSLIVVAVANPLMGIKQEKGKRAGSDIAICIDVSNSMMAEDVTPNRLARSKQMVNTLLSSMAGDRVSIIIFAGTSFIEMPLTNDYNATKLFLEQVDCSMITIQGTAIGDAIEKAMATFGYGDEDREWITNSSRAIIVISDGENHEDDAVGAAKEAAKQGVRVCTIGMGATQGTPIPGKNSGTYRRDHNGNIIITRLNEQMLKDIANAGKGVYVNGSNNINEITSLLEKLEKNDFDETVFNTYESRYQYPLAAGLLCLLVELLIFERRNKKWRMAFLFFFLFIGNAYGQGNWRQQFNQGNTYYRQQQYLEAADQYSKVLEDSTLSNDHRSKVLYNLGNSFLNLGRKNSDNGLLETAGKCYNESMELGGADYRKLYNMGNALYSQGRYTEAADHFNRSITEKNISDAQRSQAMYNMGNSLLKEAQKEHDTATLKTAISCYRNALKLDPKNDDYRYSQSLAYHLLDKWTRQNRQQQNKQQQNKQQQKQQEQNQQKQNQQKQDQQQQDKQKQDQQQQKQQNSQQQKEQKKKNDSKELNEEVNRELQRQQQKQDQQQQQKQQQKQQGQQQQKQQNQQSQKQQGQQQDQQQKGDNGNDQNKGQSQQQKQGQKKADKQNLNDEIKKEIERQKQKAEGKTDKDGKKDEKKKNGEQKAGEKDPRQQQNQMNGTPQAAKPADKQQQPNAQQGAILAGKKGDHNKKNAEALLEAVKNNERQTIKTQMGNGQPVKGYRVEKEW